MTRAAEYGLAVEAEAKAQRDWLQLLKRHERSKPPHPPSFSDLLGISEGPWLELARCARQLAKAKAKVHPLRGRASR